MIETSRLRLRPHALEDFEAWYAMFSDRALFRFIAAQVVEDGDGCRFVWTVDFLPDGMAGMQAASMEAGLAAMAKVLS